MTNLWNPCWGGPAGSGPPGALIAEHSLRPIPAAVAPKMFSASRYAVIGSQHQNLLHCIYIMVE
jgi:hypothetical protein